MRWYWWYIWLVVGINGFIFRDQPPTIETMTSFVFTSIVNVVILFIPAWIIVSVVKWLRRKSRTPSTTAEPPS